MTLEMNLRKAVSIPSYFRKRPNILKFKHILTVRKNSDLLKLCKMVKAINKVVCALTVCDFTSEATGLDLNNKF